MKQKCFFYMAGIILILFSACKKEPPVASFNHSSDSYEAGDTINFTSTSTNANSFQWEFGDGSTSTDEKPWHIYNSTGAYEVQLKVTNDDGSDEATASVTIKDPTILAFVVTKGQTEEVLSECGIILFDNQDDWLNIENPISAGYTDADGYIDFYHAKAIVYYLWAIKEETGGMWTFGGYTSTLELNQLNLYLIPAEWVPDKKAADVGTGQPVLLKRIK